MVLHLNKLESLSPKDALCQLWLKLAEWIWKRRFLNFVNVFSLFRNYLPLEKGRARSQFLFGSCIDCIRLKKMQYAWVWYSSMILIHSYNNFGFHIMIIRSRCRIPSNASKERDFDFTDVYYRKIHNKITHKCKWLQVKNVMLYICKNLKHWKNCVIHVSKTWIYY